MFYSAGTADAATMPYRGGSSDVGDVTLVAPCATVGFPTNIPGGIGHHWTVTTSGATSLAHKGITAGAKVVSGTVYDLLTKPELLAQIRNEFEEFSREKPYKTFLPADAEPPVGWNTSLMDKYRGEMEKFYMNP